jgi:AIG2-like family
MNVHGVLFDLALCDVPALDRYEELGSGLYIKLTQMVLRADAAPVRALVYVGRDQSIGIPGPDYLAEVIAAAGEWNLPEAYIAYLGTCTGVGGTGGRRNSTHAKGSAPDPRARRF